MLQSQVKLLVVRLAIQTMLLLLLLLLLLLRLSLLGFTVSDIQVRSSVMGEEGRPSCWGARKAVGRGAGDGIGQQVTADHTSGRWGAGYFPRHSVHRRNSGVVGWTGDQPDCRGQRMLRRANTVGMHGDRCLEGLQKGLLLSSSKSLGGGGDGGKGEGGAILANVSTQVAYETTIHLL